MGGQSSGWYLTGRVSQAESIRDIEIDATPFRVGRRPDLSLTLPNPAVSNIHAEFIVEPNSLSLRDLNSTNGTFVNGVRVLRELPLQAGDLIQFADVSVRLRHVGTSTSSAQHNDGHEPSDALSQLTTRSIVTHFQPIVSLRDKRIVGFESLARSRVAGLQTPREMFSVASQLNLEGELSRILRLATLEQRAMIGQSPSLFLNAHPAELASLALLDSLRKFRDFSRDLPITLEIREPDANDTERMKQLCERMTDMGIRLAYDNFGSGHSRRVELATVRPDIVKFDMHLIRDIHRAPAAQQTMLANLVRMVKELGIFSLAMGVETEAEHAVCCDIGFEYGQGFHYGKPTCQTELSGDDRSLGFSVPLRGWSALPNSGSDLFTR